MGNALQNNGLHELARTLFERSSSGTLATIDPRDGIPYTSIVECMPDPDGGGDVWMFLSTLAAHSTNLLKESRASVLLQDPMAHLARSVLSMPRMTLMGRAHALSGKEEEESQARHAAAWVEVHPAAAPYMGFSDFHFYRLEVERVRYVGGFGQMGWMSAEEWREARPIALARSIGGILSHMNEDHADNLCDYVHVRSGERPERVVMLGLDEYGFDVESFWGDGRVEGDRILFEERAQKPELVRKELVKMARSAREQLG